MKKLFLAFLSIFVFFSAVKAQDAKPEDTEVWKPVPEKVAPGEGNQPPSDAIVLFDGSSLEAWESVDGGPARWILEDGVMTVKPGTGNIQTKQAFADVQLHIEFRIPLDRQGKGQAHGNSGIFLQKRYEVQVLGSYDNKTYANGQAASIYKQSIPLVNASLPAGEWQTYDIIFTAPRFYKDGKLKSSAYITVFHNGVLVQNHFKIEGKTLYIGEPYYEAHGAAPIILQDHNNPVSYRNIWVRKL